MREMDWDTLLSAVAAAESTLECLIQPIPESAGAACPPSNYNITSTSLSGPGPSPEPNLCNTLAESSYAKELPDAVKRSEQDLLQQILSVVKLKLEIPQNPRTSADKNCGEKRAIEMHKRWTKNYQKLKEYRDKHGDCLVPQEFPDDPKLGRWVRQQRSYCQRYLSGGGNKWVQHRIKKLNELGFAWDFQDDVWEQSFRRMEAFRDKHGHCNVPNDPDNKSLCGWVRRQRELYNVFKNGKHSTMTQYRIEKLKSVGLELAIPTTTWQTRFEELVEYKRLHGTCRVSSRFTDNPQLASWVSCQRLRYRNKEQVKERSKRRREALCSIGFEWGSKRKLKRRKRRK